VTHDADETVQGAARIRRLISGSALRQELYHKRVYARTGPWRRKSRKQIWAVPFLQPGSCLSRAVRGHERGAGVVLLAVYW